MLLKVNWILIWIYEEFQEFKWHLFMIRNLYEKYEMGENGFHLMEILTVFAGLNLFKNFCLYNLGRRHSNQHKNVEYYQNYIFVLS